MRACSSCGKWRLLFVEVHGLLLVEASPIAEHRLQAHELSSCGTRAQLPCGTWDLSRPGIEPMSSALAGGFFTTGPVGKSDVILKLQNFYTNINY